MTKEQYNALLAYMNSLDERVGNIEGSMATINHELGELSGKIKPSLVPIIVKFVVFPLIIILGGLVGVKIFLPF